MTLIIRERHHRAAAADTRTCRPRAETGSPPTVIKVVEGWSHLATNADFELAMTASFEMAIDGWGGGRKAIDRRRHSSSAPTSPRPRRGSARPCGLLRGQPVHVPAQAMAQVTGRRMPAPSLPARCCWRPRSRARRARAMVAARRQGRPWPRPPAAARPTAMARPDPGRRRPATRGGHSPSPWTSSGRDAGRPAGRWGMAAASLRQSSTASRWRLRPSAFTNAVLPFARRRRAAAPGESPPSCVCASCVVRGDDSRGRADGRRTRANT